MFNAVNRTILAAVGLLILGACTDKDKQAAAELCAQSQAAIENRNFSGAIVLLDTLDSRYRAQTDIRRQGMRLRAMAIEGIALDSISSADAALAQATMDVEALRPHFRHIDSSVGLEGYFLPAGASDKVMTATGIQPRVSDKGYFYVVANVQGSSIGLNGFDIADGTERVSSSAISPARVIKVEGSESASFNPEDVETIGPWLENHPDADKLIIRGSKRNVNLKLDSKLRTRMLECYRYSRALQAQRKASILREKYERMLATARDQIANAPASDQQ